MLWSVGLNTTILLFNTKNRHDQKNPLFVRSTERLSTLILNGTAIKRRKSNNHSSFWFVGDCGLWRGGQIQLIEAIKGAPTARRILTLCTLNNLFWTLFCIYYFDVTFPAYKPCINFMGGMAFDCSCEVEYIVQKKMRQH